jgi:hypothetical protein
MITAIKVKQESKFLNGNVLVAVSHDDVYE